VDKTVQKDLDGDFQRRNENTFGSE